MHELLIKPNEWQYVDDKRNILFPWYTKPFIDILKEMDFGNKRILELGMGGSTIWWASVCRELVSVDDNPEWLKIVADGCNEKGLLNKVTLIKAENQDEYLKPLFEGNKFDVIIVDGSYRLECLKSINNSNLCTNGMVILDNFEYMPEVIEMPIYKSNPLHIYPQPYHFMWRTAYWQIERFDIISDNHTQNSNNQKIRRNML